MIITDIISKKCKKKELSAGELEFFIKGVSDGSLPDYQISALLMAIFLNGMTERETSDLTLLMANSGDVLDLSSFGEITVDKHSTGGVGDKTTLVCGPVAAAMGCKVAKMSGRGLGFTGGTVDKLESIPGFKTSLETDEFISIVNECGLCVAGQSGKLCPADKKLYALRDATETVDNMSLIASSIMSKKLAGGADCIVLDVKCGSGAFMKDEASAKALAEKMVEIGRGAGKKIAALITDMDRPLGYNIGNSLEVTEAVETLKGNGPDDLTEICILLAAKLLEIAGKGGFEECKTLAKSKIADGSALKKLAEMVKLQGGDEEYVYNTDKFAPAKFSREILADCDGYISAMNTECVGSVCVALGAGRQRKEDAIDPSAGIILCKKTGDYGKKGDLLATLYCSDEALFEQAQSRYREVLSFSETKPDSKPVLLEIVG